MDLAELKTETDNNAEYQQRYECLETSESTHSARGGVEEQNNQNVHD